jgi:hypothetical protein
MKALLTADEFRMYENLVHATGSPIAAIAPLIPDAEASHNLHFLVAVHNEEHFHIASGGIGQKP